MARVRTEVLINAASASGTTGYLGVNTAGAVNAASQATEYGVYVEFAGGSSAGTVLIETASTPTYSGTWAVLATVNWAADNKCTYVALTNAIRTFRARISSTVTGGNVTVTAIANEP